MVDAGSPGKAEGGYRAPPLLPRRFPAQPCTQLSPQSAMADWLAGGEAPGFTIDRDCELKAVGEEKSAVRYVRHPAR